MKTIAFLIAVLVASTCYAQQRVEIVLEWDHPDAEPRVSVRQAAPVRSAPVRETRVYEAPRYYAPPVYYSTPTYYAPTFYASPQCVGGSCNVGFGIW